MLCNPATNQPTSEQIMDTDEYIHFLSEVMIVILARNSSCWSPPQHYRNCHDTLDVLCVFFSISQDNFIKHLLAGTKNIDKQFALQSPETISHIINCSTAILLLSLKKCDISTNPNPTVSSKKQLYSIVHILSSQRLLQSGDVFFLCVCVFFLYLSSLCLRMSMRSFDKSLCCLVRQQQSQLFSSTGQAQSIRTGLLLSFMAQLSFLVCLKVL